MANNSVQDAKNKVQDVAHKTAEAAQNIGQDLTDAGRSAVNAAGKAVDNAANRAGEGIESLGSRVRDYGPNKGVMGQATETVAHSLEQGGQYLKQEGFTGMASDVTEMIKRNPLPALFFGIGLGFVIARLTSPRS